jgi:hypothetical protein
MRNNHEIKTRNNNYRNSDYIGAHFGRFAGFGSGTMETTVSPEESG